LDELEDLEDELMSKNYVGKVIIDLLICNGIAGNRFIEINFDGFTIDLRFITVVDSIDDEIREISSKFYKSNPTIVDNSILPKAHCYLIKKGVSV
jgi:hypothetical protein